MRILRVLFQVAQAVQALLVAQLDATQVQHRILHRHGHLLALAGLVAADQRGQDADGQVHAGVGIAQRRRGHRRRAVPEAGGRSRAAGALGHVLVDLQVFIVVAVAEALDRSHDHLGVQFVDALPREAHAVQRTRAEVLDQHVRFADQLLEDLLAFRLLGIQRQAALVAVEHGEVQRIDIRDVAQLGARHIAGTGALHLDDVCAEPRQQLRARGASLDVREVDDLDAVEWEVHFRLLLD